MPQPEIDTTNQFCVAVGGDHIRILRAEALRSIKPDEAVLLAAWLVAIAEPMSTLRFEDCLRAVGNT